MNIIIWFFGVLLTAVGAQDLEQVAREIEGELMAPCCWTQTVDKHNSGASGEIQRQVRDMLAKGRRKDEIIAHYVSRYGSRILAVPPAEGFNLTVFILPGLFLVVGGGVVFYAIRVWQNRHVIENVNTPEERIDRAYADRLALELRERE